MTEDERLIREAIEIAFNGIKEGCGPFGALITVNGGIIARSNNCVALSHDPTAHAEILAIRYAAAYLKTHDLSNCILYSSCEPCPMCLGAVYWSGIKRIVYASDRHDADDAGFSDNKIYNEITLDPSDRQVRFIRIKDPRAAEVFSLWKQMDDKIRY